MPISPPPPLSRFHQFKAFLVIFVPMCLLLAVIGVMHYYTFFATERNSRQASEWLNVDLARRMIDTDIASVVGDLLFLAEHLERRGLSAAADGNTRDRIATEFAVFGANKPLYDQIRYLDPSGMEVVRVNFQRPPPRIVPLAELQNKSGRYYFGRALALRPGDIYVSPLDLNVEGERIERPFKPMIRFATLVFDRQGRKRGIVLLNYLGQRLIDNFTRAAANIADHIMLLNGEGYWLSSPDRKDEWGFMLGNRQRFPQRFPDAWRRLRHADAGQFENENGLFTFATLHPVRIAVSAGGPIGAKPSRPENGDYLWKIVSRFSPQGTASSVTAFAQRHWTFYAAMLGLLATGAWLLALTQHRHRQAQAQNEYERRFRHTLENIGLTAVALARDGRVTFCNDYFLRVTGWAREQVEGKNWVRRFVPAEQAARVTEVLRRMDTADNFPGRYESPVTTRDGTQRLIAWNNTLSYDALGKVIGVTGIGEDITEQRRTENQLRKLSRAVQQSPSIVLITDRRGLIEYVNPKFTEVTGYTPEEVIGKNPRVLKSGETSADEYGELWRTIQSGGEWRGEFHNRKRNGQLYWESASISAIRNTNGEVTNYLAVKEDISERKRLQQEIEVRNRELARTQALAAMGRMASMIAHDLRNPLSSVKMTLQILGRQATAEATGEANELRQIALEQIRYMEDILSDMLTYSRPSVLKPEWIHIEKVLDMAIGLAQRKLEEYGVKIDTRYQPGLPTFHGDATKLRQVFSNLIVNAAQSTVDSRNPSIAVEVMVELSEAGTGIRVEIHDNGCGIDPNEQGRLFEPFFTTRAKGTGLGLAIVKRILDQHQARIGMQPNSPRGTCVAVVLPTTVELNRDWENATAETTTT